MLRTLWLAIQIGLFALAAFWVSSRPGTVVVDWLGYQVNADIGVVILAALALMLFILFLHRVVLSLFFAYKSWRQSREKARVQTGHHHFMRGLAAIAAGDTKRAESLVKQTRDHIKDDQSMALFLEALAARQRGQTAKADYAFEQLLNHKDTVFLGLRGLLMSALEQNKTAEALKFARQAQKLAPKQPWVLQTVYDLEIKQRLWAAALETLKTAEKQDAFTKDQAAVNRAALLLKQADDDKEKNMLISASGRTKQAFRASPGFVPAALRLAETHLENNKRAAAVKVIERAWGLNPHPDLAVMWGRLAPKGKSRDTTARLRWYEKLITAAPHNIEGYVAAAQEAMNLKLWGEAEKLFIQAEKLGTQARLYRLWGQMEEGRGSIEKSRQRYEMAADAPADKVWTCKDTGHIYESWSPIAEPHGSFNTIIWDYPHPRTQARSLAAAQDDMLLGIAAA